MSFYVDSTDPLRKAHEAALPTLYLFFLNVIDGTALDIANSLFTYSIPSNSKVIVSEKGH